MNDALTLAPGRRIEAVFPRMAGKVRPGVVVALGAGPAGQRTIAAAPMTSRRTNQAGRLLTPRDPDRIWRRESWLLIPMTALLPEKRILALGAALSAVETAGLLRALDDWYGPGWTARERGLSGPISTPRVLSLGGGNRKTRRARGKAWVRDWGRDWATEPE